MSGTMSEDLSDQKHLQNIMGNMSPDVGKIDVKWKAVEKLAGRDVNEILLSFAPHDVSDIRLPMIKDFIKFLQGNVRMNISFNIEMILKFEKTDMCLASPKSVVDDSANYMRLVDILMKVAKNNGKRISTSLPINVIRAEIGFISFTENLAALLLQMRHKTGVVAHDVFADLFKSFADMHQLRLRNGSCLAEDNRSGLILSTPNFICARNNRPVILIRVFNGSHLADNNNGEDTTTEDVKPKPVLGAESEYEYFSPFLRTCDNCGRNSTCCSDITHLLSKWSTTKPGNLHPTVKDAVLSDMLTCLCSSNVQPFFNNPPRILVFIVEETRVRFAKLQIDEDDVSRIRSREPVLEPLEISYSRPYNMLHLEDRKRLSDAFFRLADILG